MMRRTILPLLTALTLLAWGRTAEAELKVVSLVLSSQAQPYEEALRGFKEYLGSTPLAITFFTHSVDEEPPAVQERRRARELARSRA